MLAYLDTLIGFAVVMLGASLLITIATQFISSVLSHRGANLHWGLATLLEKIPNGLTAAESRTVATDVLTHPLISDSIFSKVPGVPNRIKFATAIDPTELVAILRDLATRAPAYTAPVPGGAATLGARVLALLGVRNPDADRCLNMVAATPSVAAVAAGNVAPLLQSAVNDLENEIGQLEEWFHTTMDRVSARFTMYAKLWTVIFALLFAAITGLNSVTLLNKLYTKGDFRSQLVGVAPQISGIADRIGVAGPTDATRKMYTDLLTKAVKDTGVVTTPPGTTPAGINSESEGDTWITQHVASADQTKVTNEFTLDLQNQRVQDAAAVRNIMSNASFDVLQFRWENGEVTWPQIPGVLATAALLSLGAPFWFNALKQLTNLRPILANKQDPPPSK